MARRLGATDGQLEALSGTDLSPFEPAWRAAIVFAGEMTPTAAEVSDRTYAELAAHWSAPQLVEITAVVALFNYFNRFATALAIPVTR